MTYTSEKRRGFKLQVKGFKYGTPNSYQPPADDIKQAHIARSKSEFFTIAEAAHRLAVSQPYPLPERAPFSHRMNNLLRRQDYTGMTSMAYNAIIEPFQEMMGDPAFTIDRLYALPKCTWEELSTKLGDYIAWVTEGRRILGLYIGSAIGLKRYLVGRLGDYTG